MWYLLKHFGMKENCSNLMAGLWSNHLCSYQRSALARPNAPSGCQTNFTSLHKVIGISEKTKKPQWLVVYILQNTLGLKPVKCVVKKAHRGGLDRLNLYLHADWVNQCMTMQTEGMWQRPGRIISQKIWKVWPILWGCSGKGQMETENQGATG